MATYIADNETATRFAKPAAAPTSKIASPSDVSVEVDDLSVADTSSLAGTATIGGTALTATAAEINRVADASGRLVAAGGTLTLTEATHEGKIICLNTASGSVVTLPASTGGGGVYDFLITTTATSNSHIIKVANATDEFRGLIFAASDTAGNPVNIWAAADNDDTITFNRGTTGTAEQGHRVQIVDSASGVFSVLGFVVQSGTEATPFSNTVS